MSCTHPDRLRTRAARARRRLLRGSLALSILAQAVPSAAQEAPGPAPDSWYAERFTQSDRGHNITHFWSQGRLLRVATVVAGVPVLTLVDATHYYAFDALRMRGVAIERSAAARALDARGERPFANESRQVIADGGEKVRSEEINGRALDVYRITDDSGRREVWVTTDELRLPIRVDLFDRASGQTSTTRYLGWSRLPEIPAGFFQPDPRVELERISYEEYVRRSAEGPVGPVPVLYADLLHGPRG